MTLGHFTSPSLLIPQLSNLDQASAINELSQRLQQAGQIEDSLAFFQAVLQSDYLSSVATENGVVFPHARMRGIEQLSFAAGFSKAGVRWRDGSSVHAVFLVAVPLAETQLYLALVAGLTRLVRTGNCINTLLRSAVPEEILDVLNREEIHVMATVHQDKS